MSRTDKTDPFWIRATWWEPHHFRCARAPWLRSDRTCDLPAEPIVTSWYGSWYRARYLKNCVWLPSSAELYADGMASGPSWFSTLLFTRPERRRVRDQITLARQQHRATGEVDVIVETDQHRHRGNYDWR